MRITGEGIWGPPADPESARRLLQRVAADGVTLIDTADSYGPYVAEIVSVQNRYNLVDRASEEVLEVCERDGLGFLPWFPLATGDLAAPGGPLDQLASAHHVKPAQVALAWLLQRSPVMLPIPGTS